MSLRHKNRGVTAEDIEWLVKETAGAALDRIRCLPGDKGQLFTLMLLPASEELRPLPEGTIAANIREYLEQCLPASMPIGSFSIVGPSYITVNIEASIVPIDPFEGSAVRDRAAEHLRAFLHPRRGGLEGNGWPFGRNVYLSEVCAALESVEGVSYSIAPTVKIDPGAVQRELTLQTSDSRIETDYPAGSLLSVYNTYSYRQDRSVSDQWLLAESIVTDLMPDTIRVTGFREGDELHILCPIEGHLTVLGPPPMETESNQEPFIVEESQYMLTLYNPMHIDFPIGSRVVFQDGCEVRLSKPLPIGGELTEDMLDMERFVSHTANHSPDHCMNEADEEHAFTVRFRAGCEVTLIHPDVITVTGVQNHEGGGYTLSALRPSKDLLLPGGAILTNIRSGVKGMLLYEGQNHVSYHEGLSMTLRFHGFRFMGTSLQGPVPVSLTLPDGKSYRLDMQLSGSRPLQDTAYLFSRELCTPGEIHVQIAE